MIERTVDKESYWKFPSIPYLEENQDILNKEVKIYEKLDGANCQIRKKEGKVVPGSRFKPVTEGCPPTLKKFQKWAMTNYEELFRNLDSRYILYGEWLSSHSLTYPSIHKNKFYLIEIYNLKKDQFLDYEFAKKIAEDLSLTEIEGFETLPLLYKGKINKDQLEEFLEGSNFGVESKEGVVLKSYQNVSLPCRGEELEMFAKLVDKKFRRIREEISLEISRELENLARQQAENKLEKAEKPVEEAGFNLNEENKFSTARRLAIELLRHLEKEGSLKTITDSELHKVRFKQATKIKIIEEKGWS